MYFKVRALEVLVSKRPERCHAPAKDWKVWDEAVSGKGKILANKMLRLPVFYYWPALNMLL